MVFQCSLGFTSVSLGNCLLCCSFMELATCPICTSRFHYCSHGAHVGLQIVKSRASFLLKHALVSTTKVLIKAVCWWQNDETCAEKAVIGSTSRHPATFLIKETLTRPLKCVGSNLLQKLVSILGGFRHQVASGDSINNGPSSTIQLIVEQLNMENYILVILHKHCYNTRDLRLF